MSKKVLVISGSPRKNGNSDILCDFFIKGAKESNNQVEKVFLHEKNVNYCNACDYCRSHNGECVQKDDSNNIIDKMIEADVIVMSSPVYFYSINAKVKALIDRCVSRYTKILNKEMYFIVSAADNNSNNLDRTIECFRGFLDCLPLSVEKGIIKAHSVWQKGEINDTKFIDMAYNMGREV